MEFFFMKSRCALHLTSHVMHHKSHITHQTSPSFASTLVSHAEAPQLDVVRVVAVPGKNVTKLLYLKEARSRLIRLQRQVVVECS